MNKEQYQRYLKTPHWRNFRDRVLLRCVVAGRYKCETCGDLFGRSEMEVHHKHYKTVGRERPIDVQVLCGGCHAATHGKERQEQQVDPRYGRTVRRETVYAELMAEAYEKLRPIHKRMIDGVITQDHFDAIKREFIDLLLINSERNFKNDKGKKT